MKKYILTMLLVFGGFVGLANAQTETSSQTANEGFVGYSFLRQDVKFERPTFTFNENTDAHGANLAYTRYLGGTTKRAGVVGVTVDLGVNFDNNEASLVTAMGGLTLKARNSKYAQPYIRALGGIARQHVNRQNITDTSDISGAYMLGGGVDFNLGAYNRNKLRFGADYINTGFNGQRQNAVRLTTGLTF